MPKGEKEEKGTDVLSLFHGWEATGPSKVEPKAQRHRQMPWAPVAWAWTSVRRPVACDGVVGRRPSWGQPQDRSLPSAFCSLVAPEPRPRTFSGPDTLLLNTTLTVPRGPEK